MAEITRTLEEVLAENTELLARLEEAEDAIRAIRSGEVDAVVVSGPEGEQIYTLTGAEHTYRILVEAMNEGALILSPAGIILYSNRTFAAMLGTPIYEVLGRSIYDFIADSDVEHLKHMLNRANIHSSRNEISLKHTILGSIPTALSIGKLDTENGPSVSAVVTDLTEHKRTEDELQLYREHLEEMVIERTKELAQSEQQVVSILESIGDGFVAFDSDWRYIYINPEADKQLRLVTGKTRDELLGKKLWEEFPYLIETQTSANYKKAVAEQVPVVFDEYYQESDSWIQFRAFPSTGGLSVYLEDITQRRQVEEERELFLAQLQKNNAELSAVLSAIQDVVITYDTSMNVQRVNPAFISIFGFDPVGLNVREVIEQTYCRWLDGRPFRFEEQPTPRALQDEVTNGQHFLVTRLDGKDMALETSSTPLRVGDQILGAVTVWHDITERKQAEEALRDSHERLHRILGTIPDGIMNIDIKGQIVFVNEIALKILGTTRKELTGQICSTRNWIFTYPDGTPMSEEDAPFNQVLVTGQISTGIESTITRPDGRVVTLSVNVSPMRGPLGNIIGTMMSITDVSERKQIEQELMETKAEAERRLWELEAFISSMADGIILFDKNRKLIAINDSALRLLGITRELAFDTWTTLYSLQKLNGKPIPIEEYPSQLVLMGKTTSDLRFKMVTQWKKSVVTMSASPVRDPKGEILGAALSFRDVADLVEFEHQREELLARERHIAEVLQRAVLPTEIISDMHDYEIAVMYRPALREAEIGGDFYDIFDLGDGRLAVLLGDVVGKGLAAAIRVASARHSVRSYAFLDPSPARVMTLTNEALSRDIGDDCQLLTAFFAVLDPKAGTITYSSAGQEPPIVSCRSGCYELKDIGGIPLGIMPGVTYDESCRSLDSEDIVVMVTDGIIEARTPDSVQFSQEGLIDFITKHREKPLKEIAAGLLEAATQHAGGQLQDDAAIVVFSPTRKDL